MPDLPPRPRSCQVPICSNEASTPLAYKYPHPLIPQVVWFCHGCAGQYARLGYEYVEALAQATLDEDALRREVERHAQDFRDLADA